MLESFGAVDTGVQEEFTTNIKFVDVMVWKKSHFMLPDNYQLWLCSLGRQLKLDPVMQEYDTIIKSILASSTTCTKAVPFGDVCRQE